MTGIERLRKLSEDILSLSLWLRLTTGTEKDWDCYQGDGRTVNDELLSIADQIEREHAEDCFRMGERAAEDREAIAWVREHGGLDYVKAEWRSRVPYDKHERARQRLLGHIAECETALGRRNVRIEELGHRVSDLTRENAELRRRAMPEGMEWMLEVWPRWSNGEYCRFGDWWTADRYGYYEPRQLRRLVIYTPELLDEMGQGDGESYGYVWDFMRPSELDYRPDKVEPPAPAVLAADGEPLEVGQTVWDTNGDELVIGALEDGGHTVACRYADVGDGIPVHGMWSPSDLTHQRPVLDADGVPIREGDTVWRLTDGKKHEVTGINPQFGDIRVKDESMELGVWDSADGFTHTKPEPPDSAERIAEDIRRMAEEWCSYPSLREASEKAASSVGEATMGVALSNLSKRCRALAERERGE